MVQKQIEKLSAFVEENSKNPGKDAEESQWDLIFGNFYK